VKVRVIYEADPTNEFALGEGNTLVLKSVNASQPQSDWFTFVYCFYELDRCSPVRFIGHGFSANSAGPE
jgi:hypothetical protein